MVNCYKAEKLPPDLTVLLFALQVARAGQGERGEGGRCCGAGGCCLPACSGRREETREEAPMQPFSLSPSLAHRVLLVLPPSTKPAGFGGCASQRAGAEAQMLCAHSALLAISRARMSTAGSHREMLVLSCAMQRGQDLPSRAVRCAATRVGV